jgi:glycosyltransferase involved in cell wall biosynthesis
MRIMHVLDSFELGGLEKMVIALAKHQQDNGHEVFVVGLAGKHELFFVAEQLGLQPQSLFKRPGRDFIKTTLQLQKCLTKAQVQLVHSHNVVPHYFSALSLAAKKSIALISTRHDLGDLFKPNKGDLLYKFAMRRSQYGVAVCEAGRRAFIESGAFTEVKSRTVVNGINLNQFRPRNEDAKRKLLTDLGVSGNPVIFGTIGMLRPVKDHKTMIKAFSVALDRGAEAILVIVGDGELLQKRKAQVAQLKISHRVFFLGKRSDTPDLLMSFDAFIQSSTSEGYSLALVEAASTGLPLLATAVGGNREIITDGLNGLIVPPKDFIVLSEAICRLSVSSELRLLYGAKALEWALKNGSIQTMYERYQTLYLEAMRSHLT